MSIFKKTISFTFLTLFIFSFFLPIYNTSAQITMPVKEIERVVGSTTFQFQGQILETPPTINPTLYFYYAKNSEKTPGALDATKIQIKPVSPGNNFTILLGIGSFGALIPDTDYTFFITDKNPIEKKGEAYTIMMDDVFHTKKTGEGSTLAESDLPVVTTESTKVMDASVTLYGLVQNLDKPTTTWFKFGTSSTLLDKKTTVRSHAKDGEFSENFEPYKIANLPKGSLYYYKACAKNTKGEFCSDKIESFGSNFGRETIENTETKIKEEETDYYPLSPLPGVGKTDCIPENDKTTCIDTAPEGTKPGTAFASYLNAMITIFIGLCAVLAMIMIIMGGIQYMTSELVSGKEAGKKSIMNAVFGLILALGAYAILNTLNPDLLDMSLGNMTTQTIQLQTTEKTIGSSSPPATDSDIEKTATLFGYNIPGGVNKSILPDLKKMDAAYAALDKNSTAYKYIKKGLSITRGYVKNDVTDKDPVMYSAHASGLAIDINGQNLYPKEPNYYPLNTRASSCITDMPSDFVKLFTDQGWMWGATFYDPMHFSKFPIEVNEGTHNYCTNTGTSSGTPTTSNVETITKVQITKKTTNYPLNSLRLYVDNINTKKAYTYQITTTGGSAILVSKRQTTYDTKTKTLLGIVDDSEYNNIAGKEEGVNLWSNGKLVNSLITTITKTK